MDPGPVPGSATLSWQADARPSVEGYRVRAVSQQLVAGEQPVPPEAAVAQPEGCVPVSVTVYGLVPGTTYVFWLEEDVRTDLTVRRVHVGTTAPVVVS
ncbi:fibronectin type III domain-containing protein [Geodermatophilus sp. CPCC 206100]|uniref:fibronectin type III domain-containing protein n=1 Tax=Geodermatophilus sp. CPCC 206100 TaxID=3020054 RepID=UPI003B009886